MQNEFGSLERDHKTNERALDRASNPSEGERRGEVKKVELKRPKEKLLEQPRKRRKTRVRRIKIKHENNKTI